MSTVEADLATGQGYPQDEEVSVLADTEQGGGNNNPPGPGQVIGEAEDVVKDGHNGGGGGGGGSSGGGSAAADAYRNLLYSMNLPPSAWAGLIGQAASGNWGSAEFLFNLSHTPQFQRMFPGINHLIRSGMSVTAAVAAWRGLASDYKAAAHDLGLSRLAHLTPQRVGFAIQNDLSVEEFSWRLTMLDLAKHTKGFQTEFNRVLGRNGREKLDDVGWYKFIMGKADARIYNLYEATSLLQELRDEGLRIKEARQLSKMVGPEGGGLGPGFNAADFAKAYNDIQYNLGTGYIKEAGLRAKDVAMALLEPNMTSAKAKKKAGRFRAELEQLVRNVQGVETSKENTAIVLTEQGRPVSQAAMLP